MKIISRIKSLGREVSSSCVLVLCSQVSEGISDDDGAHRRGLADCFLCAGSARSVGNQVTKR